MPIINVKQDYIVLPVKLVEEVFPATNAVFIKVYLHILMLLSKGNNISFESVANSLQLLESDVMQAVRYWENLGVLEMTDGAENKGEEENTFSNPLETDAESYDIADITKRIESNEKLSEMLHLAQQVMSATLSPAEMKSLYWFYDKLGFSPEVILMLLEYCVSIGKKSMSYIERVALGWHKRGIYTIEAVENFLSEEEMKNNYMNNLKQVFGIHDRRLTGIEEDYLSKWHDVLGMPEEMIALAYEYCILRINKLSFQYMDKIIENWHANGISTIAAAEEENEKFRKANSSGDSNGFDILKNDVGADELEKFTWDKIDK